MDYKIKDFLFIVFSFFGFFSFAQNKYPQNFFGPPISAEYNISSNFGEIRPSHFHAGLDYNTKKKIGICVYAAADGYVSRVKVSSKGYGNALYITHPNGFVTVYCHLSQFEHEIADYVSEVQSERQQFEIDDYLYPGMYKVKKGQIIAKSGNTGSSFGPHLHFEIRDAITEEPINTLLFGLKFPDTEPPRIEGLYFYQFAKGMENYNHLYSEFVRHPKIDTIHAFGTLGFGVEIHDYMIKKKKERFGVYEIEMRIDDALYFKSRMERISFDDSKYLNSFTDYDLYKNKGLKVSKCFVEPNNKLPVYQTKGRGLFDFSDGLLHKIQITGKDIVGNAEDLIFYLQSDSTKKVDVPLLAEHVVKEINCFKIDSFITDSFKIHFPENSLYYYVKLKYSKSQIWFNNFSDLYNIGNVNIPLHSDPAISIKPHFIPAELRNKVLIVGIDYNQNHFSAGGKWNGDFVETQISSFGSYYVDVDTICPRINPISLKKSIEIKSNKIQFKIFDNLSGIDDYVAYIDNKWVLFEYDEKSALITCNLLSEKIEHGEHELIIWVKDKCGNIKTSESKFNY
jgi:hypothetical protein